MEMVKKKLTLNLEDDEIVNLKDCLRDYLVTIDNGYIVPVESLVNIAETIINLCEENI